MFLERINQPQIEVVIRADVSENRLAETKNNFGDYDISQPTPSVPLSAPSCSLGPKHSSSSGGDVCGDGGGSGSGSNSLT